MPPHKGGIFFLFIYLLVVDWGADWDEEPGCVPCGTSLILPIVALFFSGAAAATATNIASTIVLILALILSLFSIYKSGQIAFMYTELEKQEETWIDKNQQA